MNIAVLRMHHPVNINKKERGICLQFSFFFKFLSQVIACFGTQSMVVHHL